MVLLMTIYSNLKSRPTKRRKFNPKVLAIRMVLEPAIHMVLLRAAAAIAAAAAVAAAAAIHTDLVPAIHTDLAILAMNMDLLLGAVTADLLGAVPAILPAISMVMAPAIHTDLAILAIHMDLLGAVPVFVAAGPPSAATTMRKTMTTTILTTTTMRKTTTTTLTTTTMRKTTIMMRKTTTITTMMMKAGKALRDRLDRRVALDPPAPQVHLVPLDLVCASHVIAYRVRNPAVVAVAVPFVAAAGRNLLQRLLKRRMWKTRMGRTKSMKMPLARLVCSSTPASRGTSTPDTLVIRGTSTPTTLESQVTSIPTTRQSSVALGVVLPAFSKLDILGSLATSILQRIGVGLRGGEVLGAVAATLAIHMVMALAIHIHIQSSSVCPIQCSSSSRLSTDLALLVCSSTLASRGTSIPNTRVIQGTSTPITLESQVTSIPTTRQRSVALGVSLPAFSKLDILGSLATSILQKTGVGLRGGEVLGAVATPAIHMVMALAIHIHIQSSSVCPIRSSCSRPWKRLMMRTMWKARLTRTQRTRLKMDSCYLIVLKMKFQSAETNRVLRWGFWGLCRLDTPYHRVLILLEQFAMRILGLFHI